MPRFTDDALVIRVQEWSETSQIVTLLTRRRGKVRGLAKGSKRLSPSSVQRFSGGFELLTGGQVVAITRPTSELASLIEWDLVEPCGHLRRDLAALQWSYYAADAVHALIADEDEHEAVYAAMLALLEGLAKPEATPRDDLLLRFQWQLLSFCGYRPVVERDVITEQSLGERATCWFDARRGGLTADAMDPPDPMRGPWRVRRETVEALRAVASQPSLTGSTRMQADRRAIAGANRLLCVYVRAILDRHLPTMDAVLDAQG